MSRRKTETLLDFGRGVLITSDGRQTTLIYGTKDKRHYSDITSALKALLKESLRGKLVERAGKVESFLQALEEAERGIEEVIKRSLGNGDKGSTAEDVRAEPAPVYDNSKPGASTPFAGGQLDGGVTATINTAG